MISLLSNTDFFLFSNDENDGNNSAQSVERQLSMMKAIFLGKYSCVSSSLQLKFHGYWHFLPMYKKVWEYYTMPLSKSEIQSNP